MASSDPNHRRHHTNPQSIPLQDLHRPPEDDTQYVPGDTQRHRRTLSDRGRNLLRQTHSIASGHWAPQYAPVAEASPSPTRAGTSRPALNPSYPPVTSAILEEEDGGYSPVEDGAAFQAAMGFAGLSFQGEEPQSPPILTPLSSPRSDTHSYVQRGSDPYISSRHTSEDRSYFPPTTYEDTAPLTDQRHLQPISGINPSTPAPQVDRSSFQSVRFLTPDGHTPASSRTTMDLGHVEAASGHRPRQRSLSPGAVESPLLHRAGTIMRNMSQRVVNISNEPEIAERTLRRKSSLKHARLQEPPSFPALPVYSHDGPPSPASPIEKPQSPIETSSHPPWIRHPNPLRGKSLGIFPPDSTIRVKLCDLLVQPVTEPILLILIIIQTILLAVDSSQSVFKNPRSETWGKSWIDYALLGLFVVYTIEIIIRVIVSGFIVNPVEYSTINRKIGLRDAIWSKGRQLFTPNRQPSLKRATTFDPHQPSVMRTFTGAQMHPEAVGDSRQQARIRLAHRAYLRHSFNRTDFLAVMSFWIAFVLGMRGEESKHHIYIFRMLSCLRIIRLLNLTSGTSVGLILCPFSPTMLTCLLRSFCVV